MQIISSSNIFQIVYCILTFADDFVSVENMILVNITHVPSGFLKPKFLKQVLRDVPADKVQRHYYTITHVGFTGTQIFAISYFFT